jgi:hypothetical protein
MNKIVCYTRQTAPSGYDDVHYFELFPRGKRPRNTVKPLGLPISKILRKHKIIPTVPTLDFTAFALAVVAADKLFDRSLSVDGWTRKIDLTIYLRETEKWNNQKNEVEKMLRFLTGDFWTLSFIPSGYALLDFNYSHEQKQNDCTCLLSGGIDSLVGAVDLVSDKANPLFSSQIVRGDAELQNRFANTLTGTLNHTQWSAGAIPSHEGSTRARSIMFFACALLAACALPQNDQRKKIFVPENGFISLNIPMSTNRIGSLSTKTTHPVYMKAMQNLWNELGINVELVLPYKFKTKGEIVKECKNPDVLKTLIYNSVSCGKYRRHNLQHCGVCVPCLVRRASFLEAGLQDITTKGYINENIKHADSCDVAAVAMAIKQVDNFGLEKHIKSGLSFANSNERNLYSSVVSRGLIELENLLRNHRVL